VIVHARKAWLKGLSPKENRTIPPLDYARVYDLKKSFPDLTIVINGGITSMQECREHLRHVDGVMLGRTAYEEPYTLAEVDRELFGTETPPLTRIAALEAYLPYCEREVDDGTPLHHMTRHMLGLFHGCPGARAWRRFLSTEAVKPGATADVLKKSLEFVNPSLKAA